MSDDKLKESDKKETSPAVMSQSWQEVRSEEMQEILHRAPNWMLRSGISMLFILFIIFLIISWFIKYPDIINSNVIITSQNPPIALIAQSGGRIETLLVKDKQLVIVGTVLAVIENPTDYNNVFALEKQLDSVKANFFNNDRLLNFNFLNYQLGDIQLQYTLFTKSLSNYKSFIEIDSYRNKISALKRQIKAYDAYQERLSLQSRTLENQFTLVKKKYKTDSLLEQQHVIPPSALDDSKAILLQKNYECQGSQASIAQVNTQIKGLENTVTDLELQLQQDSSSEKRELINAYENLKSQIDSWKQRYLLRAPITGTVSFSNYWSEKQAVKQGDEVMTIVPVHSEKIIGRLGLPMERSAKVSAGQIVNIKLAAYPSDEYGLLIGKIVRISTVPYNNSYSVDVEFPQGLKTSYGKELEFKQEMNGSAEIITKKRNLLQRVFSKFKFMFDKHL